MEVCEMKKDQLNKIKKFAYKMRKNILKMSFEAGASSSHLGGALSIVEIVAVLFSSKMKLDKKNINWSERDRFILSKGHACLAYYAALAGVKIINEKDLETFEKDGTNFLGHPVMNKDIGIDFSTGSLGMGLSIGIGLAISAKKRKKNFNVFVILGDGECNEGSIWEGAMAAPNFDLENLFVIVDKNNFQQTGSNNEIMKNNNLALKWKSFGWEVSEVDGHNISELLDFFNRKSSKPKLLIANTIKGKGFTFSENNNDWHYAVLTKNFYEKGLIELEQKYEN
jgi:transketolase